jgi:hypothetical protein
VPVAQNAVSELCHRLTGLLQSLAVLTALGCGASSAQTPLAATLPKDKFFSRLIFGALASTGLLFDFGTHFEVWFTLHFLALFPALAFSFNMVLSTSMG